MRATLTSLVSALLLGACAPLPPMRLVPRGDPVWSDGRAYGSAERESVLVVLGFEGSTADLIAFDVEVVNRSARPVLVDPAAFRCVFAGSKPPENAFDPEVQLLRLDERAEALEAQRKTDGALDAIGALLGVADLFVNFGRVKSEQEEQEEAARQYEEAASREKAQAEHERLETELAAERQRWSEGVLRITMLQPGDSRRGLVYFPRTSTSNLAVHIVLGSRVFIFDFIQTGEPGTAPGRGTRRSPWASP